MTDLTNLFDQTLATTSNPTPPQPLNDVSNLIDQEIKSRQKIVDLFDQAIKAGPQPTPSQQKLNNAIQEAEDALDDLIQ
ncbi:MAG: hypothetical protein F6K55_06160 [Moorea sp. SIO4A3]|nr:hypothetical protein [Moorena sp. SIO4A3]